MWAESLLDFSLSLALCGILAFPVLCPGRCAGWVWGCSPLFHLYAHVPEAAKTFPFPLLCPVSPAPGLPGCHHTAELAKLLQGQGFYCVWKVLGSHSAAFKSHTGQMCNQLEAFVGLREP